MRNTASRNPVRGTTVVEMALATIVFFMLTLAVIDLGRMQFFRSRLQYAVSQSTRFAATGNTMTDPNTNKAMSRQDSIVAKVKQLSGISNLGTADIVMKATNEAGTTANGPGNGGDLVTLQATYSVPVLAPYLSSAFPNGKYKFTCATTYRNELFLGSGSGSGSSGSGSSSSVSNGSGGGDDDSDSDSD
jgi:Flp pilus assembly protein TadG